MGIKTTQTSHSSKGKRTYNEDIVLSNNDDLFIVCDGVGGETNGKEAAHITAHAAQQYFTKNSTSNVNTVRFSAHIESSFDSYINLEPKCNGMASTLSLCKFYSDRILFLWAGDTRIYHFRNGKILHKTRDHSFAQQMLEQGYLSEQEISTHPHRNVILKAFHSYT